MKKLLLCSILLAFSILISSASGKTFRQVAERERGKTENQVILDLGSSPNKTTDDGKGGKVLTWYYHGYNAIDNHGNYYWIISKYYFDEKGICYDYAIHDQYTAPEGYSNDEVKIYHR